MAVCAEYRIPHSEFLAWDQSDRDKAIWWHVRSKEACPSCGTRRDEWKPDKGGHEQAYIPAARRCNGCAAIEQFRKGGQVPELPGVQIFLKRNPES